ncbi:DUF1641 domain-containing protein [Halopseudomonas nanhaiensis]|uniref:DUF1641 domain-containing protein n=1 Tax=Halopseudomonas nanhaiensis TaxID=2830842 RepID=UPI001CBC8BD8|nr:DUF1641 domain-containing protein [Halopseudomonas nanhaiensis]UAW97110.1 DUF1641 domain-containing protein [Halopseudomonas nanhaiensis]
MAEPIDYDVKPTPIGPDAHEELERLLQSLHEGGVLRFANDLVSSKSEVTKVLVDGLNQEGSLNAVQNLSILLMALSRIEPGEFYKVVFGLKDAMTELSRHAPQNKREDAPGITGAYKMLHDDKLWASLTPLIGALKVFAERLGEDTEKPVTKFTGKQTEL